MKRRFNAIALTAALGLAAAAAPAFGEDLLQIYREAQQNDPTIAAAKANWQATQEAVPQARAGLLPNASASGSASENQYDATIKTDPQRTISSHYAQYTAIVSAAQPLYRQQNWIAYDEAKQQVSQADNVLTIAQQDLILRVSQAYFDVLLAQYNIELNDSQKAAVSEQLAQAKRNFEVGVATITDTNEAQAKYDSIVAQEITTRNDYDNKVTALRAIIGRQPKELKKVGAGFEAALPEPNQIDYWVDRALKENQNVQVGEKNFEIAKLEVDKAKAGHYPTLDLVGSLNWANYGGGAINFGVANYSTIASIGVQLAVPIYQGGFVDSKVRQAIALQEKARQDLETARRTALFLAQTGFTGVTSAAASIKATQQALVSAEVALQSNKLGQEVGIRTNLDVLNVQQNVFSTRRDLAQAYFNYLIGVLRLKSAIGTLSDSDVETINRQLRG
ncbi:MAG TPA: TolC family outer membrane protein [Casimicrobiaceae bacterium]